MNTIQSYVIQLQVYGPVAEIMRFAESKVHRPITVHEFNEVKHLAKKHHDLKKATGSKYLCYRIFDLYCMRLERNTFAIQYLDNTFTSYTQFLHNCEEARSILNEEDCIKYLE